MQESNLNEAIKESIEKQPDERGGINVRGHIKIFDPETQEIFVQESA